MPADIRVRLTPEGLADVLAALKAAQKQADSLGRSGGAGITVVNDALRDLKSLLPAIGLAAAVTGLASLAKNSLSGADAMGKLAQKVGSSTEELSALSVAFKLNNASQEDVQASLVATAKRLDELRSGSEPTVEAFSRIGLSLKDFAGKDTVQSLELIAKKLAAIPDSAEKTALAQQLLNRSSADLIPTLNDLGTKGLQFFMDKAKDTGNLLTGDFTSAASAAADALTELQLRVTGTANEFTAGFAPALTGVIEDLTKAFGSDSDAQSSIKNFAVFIGIVIRTVLAVFTTAAQGIGAFGAIIGSTSTGIIDAVVNVAHGRGQAALDDLKGIVTRGGAIIGAFSDDIDKKLEALSTPPAPKAPAPVKTGTIAPPVDPGLKIIADARLAATQKMYANEREVQKADLASKVDAEKDAFDQGIVNYQEYFAARKALLVANNASELANLKAQRASLQAAIVKPTAGVALTPTQKAGNIKINSDIATVNSQISVQQIQSAQQLAALQNEELDTARRLAKEREGSLNTIDDLEENRHAVFERNLAQELADFKKLGAQAGTDVAEISAEADRLAKARTAAFNVDEASRQGSAAMTEFQRQSSAINDQVSSGILSQVQGEQQIAELQKAQLPQLKANAQALLDAANATGSPEQIEKAKAFSDSVASIANSYKATTDAALQFEVGGLDAFDKGLESLLGNIASINSVGDAFRQLALTVAQALGNIAAQILAKQATLALARAFNIVAPAAHLGGLIQGYSEGDVVAGRALNIQGPDKVPALLEPGEFVTRRAATQQPGAIAFLRQFNAGHISMAGLRRAGIIGFASGGSVGSVGGTVTPAADSAKSATQGVRIVNVLDPQFVSEGLATPASERAILNVIDRNSGRISRSLR